VLLSSGDSELFEIFIFAEKYRITRLEDNALQYVVEGHKLHNLLLSLFRFSLGYKKHTEIKALVVPV